jgi:hypothetical protein
MGGNTLDLKDAVVELQTLIINQSDREVGGAHPIHQHALRVAEMDAEVRYSSQQYIRTGLMPHHRDS